MARLFDDALLQYLAVGSAPITSYPFTMGCRFRSDDDTVNQELMWVGDKDVANKWCSLQARGGVAGDFLRAFSHTYGGATTEYAVTTSGFSANTWHHGCAVFPDANNRFVYIDGGSKGTDANAVGAMSDHDSAAIGRQHDSTPGAYFSGRICEAAIWNVALTDAEVAIQGAGYSPLFVRPQNLIAYWPLIRTDDDIVGGYSMTPVNGPTVAAHCPVLYPTVPMMGVPAAVVAAAALPVVSGDGIHSLVFGGVTVR